MELWDNDKKNNLYVKYEYSVNINIYTMIAILRKNID